MLCVPSGVTTVEKRAVINAAKQAGARDAFLIEETLAAAIGSGLPDGNQLGAWLLILVPAQRKSRSFLWEELSLVTPYVSLVMRWINQSLVILEKV